MMDVNDGTTAITPSKSRNKDSLVEMDSRVYIDFSLVQDQGVEYEKPLLGNLVHNLFAGTPTKGVVPNDFDLTVDTQNVSFMGRQKRHRGKIFPVRLYEILSYGSQVEHIISWLPHGRSFIVRDPGLFTDEIIPRFFKHTQYKSFIRQLSLWGFKRIVRGPGAGSYYHQLFLRSKPGILIKMVNKTDKVIETYTPRNAGGVNVAESVVLDANIDRRTENDAPPLFYALAEKRPLPNLSIRIDPLPSLNGKNGDMPLDSTPSLDVDPNGLSNSSEHNFLQQRQFPTSYHHQASIHSLHEVPSLHAPVPPPSHVVPPPMNAVHHQYAGLPGTRNAYGNTTHSELLTHNFDCETQGIMLQQRQFPPSYHHQASMPSLHEVPSLHAPVPPPSHVVPPRMNDVHHQYAGLPDTRNAYGNTSHSELLTHNFGYDTKASLKSLITMEERGQT